MAATMLSSCGMMQVRHGTPSFAVDQGLSPDVRSQAQTKDLSSRSTFNPVKATIPRRAAQTFRSVSCSAQAQESSKPLQTVLAATALAAALGFGSVDAARADISGLTPCAESKSFAKRQKTEVKVLQKRLKNVRVRCSLTLSVGSQTDTCYFRAV